MTKIHHKPHEQALLIGTWEVEQETAPGVFPAHFRRLFLKVSLLSKNKKTALKYCEN